MNFRDFKQICRSLRRQPQFTIPAVLALALGVGANAVIFTLINRILLRPLPYREPHQLTVIYSSFPSQGIARGPMGMGDFLDIRSNSRQFQDLAAYHVTRFNLAPLNTDDTAQGIICSRATASFFNLLGPRPLIGRLFQPGDDTPGKTGVVVLSEKLWRAKYGANPGVIGQTANILLYLGIRHGMAPKAETGRLWVHQLQLTVADLVLEIHDTHHPLGPTLYYEQQRAAAKKRSG